MRKIPKIHVTPYSETHARLMRRPGVRKAYKDLELEFSIFDALIEARSKRGMTQAKLAKKLGTKQSAIARFESGRGNPTWEFMQKLTNALDLDIKVIPRH